MPKITLEDQHYAVSTDESVLDALLRQGVEVPHGCKAGACHSCIMRLEDGEVPATAQAGLKASQKELGYFLSCSWNPSADIGVSFTDQALPKSQARVLDVSRISEKVLRIRLEKTFDFKAGQYFNIWLDDTTVRSYSIASSQSLDDFIELHVKLLPNGRFSQWADEHLRAGDTLTVQGPMGECFYSLTDPQQPMLLIGIGTGLAPLYGIIREAIHNHHKGPIHLVVGARSGEDFYLQDELANVACDTQVKIDFVCLDGASPHHCEGDLYQFVKQQYASTKGWCIYLCGAESFVGKMKKQCFLAGANMRDIHADAFLPCS